MREEKRIAFCITCMNRLSHIQQTLVRNIENNFIPNDVEFILLDYNSNDGLEEWVKTLQKYIDLNILHYYRIETPVSYHRSHSRNMAFRLANAEIVCNLDADNFLGKGFAEYIMKQFAEAKEKIFITSPLDIRDTFGRFCAYREDFLRIRGYNELLSGYGAEDTDIYKRFAENGLKQEVFIDPAFCMAINHSWKERISQEYYYRSLAALYISYEMPFRNIFLLLKKDFSYESAHLIDNSICNFNIPRHYSNPLESDFDILNRIALENEMQKGKWTKTEGMAQLTIDERPQTFSLSDAKIRLDNRDFHKISDEELLSVFIAFISTAINYAEAKKIADSRTFVNSTGFGQGSVFKNFDYKKSIILD